MLVHFPPQESYIGEKDVNGQKYYCCSELVDIEDMCDSGVYYITYDANGKYYLAGCGDASGKPDQCVWPDSEQKKGMKKAK